MIWFIVGLVVSSVIWFLWIQEAVKRGIINYEDGRLVSFEEKRDKALVAIKEDVDQSQMHSIEDFPESIYYPELQKSIAQGKND